jgi:hypothetical protein
LRSATEQFQRDEGGHVGKLRNRKEEVSENEGREGTGAEKCTGDTVEEAGVEDTELFAQEGGEEKILNLIFRLRTRCSKF